MKDFAIEHYSDQCKIDDLWDFIEDNLSLKGFPSPAFWITKRALELRRKNNEILLAMIDNKMIGCIVLNRSLIEILCIKRRYRKRGIGNKLVRYAEELLKKDARRKYLRVDSFKPFKAKNFYDKMGFETYNQSEYCDTWHFRRKLNE
ncbi:MAG: GNAT family N-acetyltransferase [Synergistaceae bacterium]